jgi:alpha-ketoglutarate-dependent taurine dioxygenase
VSYQTKDLKPLIGAEVSADREALLAGEYSAQLRELLEQRGVLLFRELDFDDTQQFEFAKTLGEVLPQGEKGIYKITLDKRLNDTADYLHATYHWHIDGAQDMVPQLASLLSARVLSDVGGQTEFANTYAAYEHLPEDKKRLADTLRVVHSQEYIQRAMHPDPTEEQLARWRQHSEQVHPMVWTHRSGRKSLVLGLTAGRIDGVPEDEGRSIIDEMQAWATQPQFVYRHHWTVGDMIIWDNTGVMHRVEKYPADSGRLLSRTTLVGEEPIA